MDGGIVGLAFNWGLVDAGPPDMQSLRMGPHDEDPSWWRAAHPWDNGAELFMQLQRVSWAMPALAMQEPQICTWLPEQHEQIQARWVDVDVQMLRPKVDPIKSEVPRQARPPIHNKLFGPRHRHGHEHRHIN